MRKSDVICLGTVKLGIPDYGFASRELAKDFDAVSFLEEAAALGINRFDTSPHYGQSEEVLGRYIAQSKKKPLLSSKIDNLKPSQPQTPQIMLESVNESLRKLHLDSLDICYLHQNEIEIISDSYVHKGLALLKQNRLIRSSGASLYNNEECVYALQSGIFDVIQVPVSVFNLDFYNRFIKNNHSPVRFAARSLLLQGILVNRQGAENLVPNSEKMFGYLSQLDELAQNCGLSVLEMALAFVFSLKNIDHYLIGTNSVENLQKDINCLKIELSEKIFNQLSEMASECKDWNDPRNWNKDMANRSYN